MTALLTAVANNSSDIWILGSFTLLSFSSVIGLYVWVGARIDSYKEKMERLTMYHIKKSECENFRQIQEIKLDNLKEGQDHLSEQVDKLVDHLIGENKEN